MNIYGSFLTITVENTTSSYFSLIYRQQLLKRWYKATFLGGTNRIKTLKGLHLQPFYGCFL